MTEQDGFGERSWRREMRKKASHAVTTLQKILLSKFLKNEIKINHNR